MQVHYYIGILILLVPCMPFSLFGPFPLASFVRPPEPGLVPCPLCPRVTGQAASVTQLGLVVIMLLCREPSHMVSGMELLLSYEVDLTILASLS